MQPSGVRNLRLVVAEDDRGAAVLRSDMPHRARIWVAGNSDVKGFGNGGPPHLHSVRTAYWAMPLASSQVLAPAGNINPTRLCPLAYRFPCDIVASTNRCLEDQCLNRPSRSSLSAKHPANPGPTLRNGRSGEGWMLTSPKSPGSACYGQRGRHRWRQPRLSVRPQP